MFGGQTDGDSTDPGSYYGLSLIWYRKESDWPLSKVPCKQDGETGRVSVQIIGDSRRKYGITVPIKYRC